MTLQSKSRKIIDIVSLHELLNTTKILPAYSPKIESLFMQINQPFLISYLFHFILYEQCWINTINSPTSEAITLPPVYCSSSKNNPTPLLSPSPPQRRLSSFPVSLLLKL